MSFKPEFYTRYVTTHTGARKGTASAARFRAKFPGWQARFGHLLPDDRAAPILDVGCGNGILLYWLQASGYREAHGFDLSVEQIEVARSLGVQHVEVADLHEYLRRHAARYAVIFLRDVLEHFERQEILEILDLVRAALRPGGRLVLQVPNGTSPFMGRVRWGDFTHEMAFTQSSLAQLFAVCGFEQLSVESVAPRLHGWRSVPRVLLWKAVEAFYRICLYAELGRGDYIVTQNVIAHGRRPMAGTEAR